MSEHKPRIQLKEWAAISRPEFRRMATVPDWPLPLRAFFAALGRANQIGHAELGPGELANILRRKDGSEQTKQGVSRAVREAKVRRLLHASSTARCLVLPSHMYDIGQGSLFCREHGIRRAA
ncbi:hypothetical protein [Streptomyces sp. NPDC020965]|uniref:hypothetical protein n=1 Tax=Streptomyces sp. NPDC020965 TaxID=3365105 RepID=UPI0037AC682C